MHKRSRGDGAGFRARVEGLVDQHFGGSQKKAAGAWGISQSTLNRFLTTVTSRPGVDFAQKIARYHKVSLGWLIDGEGTAPALPEEPADEGEAWRKLVQSLGLDREAERAVMILPTVTGRAFRDLTLRNLGNALSAGTFFIAPAMARSAWQAACYEYLAWTHLLQGMLDAYGREAVVAKLNAEWLPLALGYQGLALNLYAIGTITDEAIEAEFAEYALHPGLSGGLMGRPWKFSEALGLEATRVQSGAARGSKP